MQEGSTLTYVQLEHTRHRRDEHTLCTCRLASSAARPNIADAGPTTLQDHPRMLGLARRPDANLRPARAYAENLLQRVARVAYWRDLGVSLEATLRSLPSQACAKCQDPGSRAIDRTRSRITLLPQAFQEGREGNLLCNYACFAVDSELVAASALAGRLSSVSCAQHSRAV